MKKILKEDLFYLDKVKSRKVSSEEILFGKKNKRYNDNNIKSEFFYKPIMLL